MASLVTTSRLDTITSRAFDRLDLEPDRVRLALHNGVVIVLTIASAPFIFIGPDQPNQIRGAILGM